MTKQLELMPLRIQGSTVAAGCMAFPHLNVSQWIPWSVLERRGDRWFCAEWFIRKNKLECLTVAEGADNAT